MLVSLNNFSSNYKSLIQDVNLVSHHLKVCLDSTPRCNIIPHLFSSFIEVGITHNKITFRFPHIIKDQDIIKRFVKTCTTNI